jgi:glycerol-3-phosphate dehydrogenase (NAD(P)+)
VPSASLRANLAAAAPWWRDADVTVLSAVKGIEPGTAFRMSEVIAEAGVDPQRIAVISGPNFALEIARGLPAATVIAAADAARSALLRDVFGGPAFRVYTSGDVVGVEIGGALKNAVAIACGISDGLGFGDNAKAALVTRALAEVTRLGVACGAEPMTFLGLAGMGDLVATCYGSLSRNRRLGLALARGQPLAEALAGIDGVVEGVVTVGAALTLAARHGLELPICQQLEAVLHEGRDPRRAVSELMGRAPRDELAGFRPFDTSPDET